MTPKQERFVAEYLVDLNATQAAIRAGYAKSGAATEGHRLLRNAQIQSRLTEWRQEIEERSKLTVEQVIERLDEVARRCMQAEPVLDRKGRPVYVENAEGEEVPAYTFQAMGANRALELIGKHLGAFVEQHRHEHSGPGGGPIETAQLLDVRLLCDECLAKLKDHTEREDG